MGDKKYYESHREQILEQKKKYNEDNKKTISEKKKQHYLDNKELYAAKNKIYCANNKERLAKIRKEWVRSNSERIAEYQKEYRAENKENRKKYLNNLYRNNIEFKILCSCRGRVYSAIKGKSKSLPTRKLIGCTVQYLVEHIESQFQEGMNWENYGEWHIDHIIPCASFDFTKKEDQIKCFNYTNLQPMWAMDNIKKSNKIIGGNNNA